MSLQTDFSNCSEPDPRTGCLVWKRGTHKDGYGHLRVEGKQKLAHRHAWELVNGPIPSGMCVCHHCDNRACVNPEHMFLADHNGNMRDRRNKDRFSRKLSREQVVAMREKYLAGATQRALAREFRVSFQAVHLVVRNKNWVHV